MTKTRKGKKPPITRERAMVLANDYFRGLQNADARNRELKNQLGVVTMQRNILAGLAFIMFIILTVGVTYYGKL